MKIEELAKKLEGTQTIESVMVLLEVSRPKAVYFVYRLRKKGYVITKRTSKGKRVYYVSPQHRLKGTSYFEMINKYSPIKIVPRNDYLIYGKKPSLEEVFIFALDTRNLRTILASLGLFRQIHDWQKMYTLAKQKELERKVGALYDLAKRYLKTRKMVKRFRNNSLPQKGDRYQYIIKNFKSKDFQDIEKRWRVHLPFNKQDLEEYI
ncbi:MAG: hypothetical protein ABIA37_01840 [Candidatus Woesearchaeota archaeon]